MSHPLTVELSDAAYAALQLRAHAAALSPAAAAAAALEQHFGARMECLRAGALPRRPIRKLRGSALNVTSARSTWAARPGRITRASTPIWPRVCRQP